MSNLLVNSVDAPGSVPAYPQDIATLTGLRFFAAMLVVFHHLTYFLPFDITAHTWFFTRSALAVDFFFILSGFILAHVYGDGFKNGQIGFRHFITRRFARLYPLHLLTLLVAVLLMGAGLEFRLSGQESAVTPYWPFIGHVFLLQGWGVDNELLFNVPSWSISAEWFAYLFFPGLMLFLARKKPLLALTGSVFLMVALWCVFDLYMPRVTTRLTHDGSMFRIMPEFMMGIALYLYSRSRPPRKYAGWRLVLCACALPFLLHYGVADIVVVLLFLGMIGAAADLSRCGYNGWLVHKNTIFWGDASYAVYMVHYIMMVLILRGSQSVFGEEFYLDYYPVLFAVVVMATLVAAAVSYRFFETPLRRRVTVFCNSIKIPYRKPEQEI